ncbi:MAG: hypothetical protein CMH32_06680 [Micavibrio sp.]|nr:hypothetical protein [Micavibrio sp.]HCK33314.1 hypothetical protein [Rhodospirillaceae bacterium]
MTELRDSVRRDLEKKAQKLLDAAKVGYTQLGNGQTVPVSAVPYIRNQNGWQTADIEHGVRLFKRDLTALGFDGFKFYNKGSTARVFIGRRREGNTYRYYAIRTSEYGTGEDGNDRAPTALNLQPYMQLTTDAYCAERLEILPLVHMVHNDFGRTLRQAFLPVLKVFNVITGNFGCFMSKDLAVFPDGTPVEADPGNLNIAPDTDARMVQADLEVLEGYAKSWGLGAPYEWYTNDGYSKQEAFFPSTFENVQTLAHKWQPK